jgi:branched-chain amino acid transport system ATP-binding protein
MNEGNGSQAALLEISDVTAGYGGRAVISDVSLNLASGEAVGIVGHNGAGKTTLLNSVFGKIKPMSGSITFRGTPLAANPRQSINEGLAIVPAEKFVFTSLSVRENLKIARDACKDPATALASEKSGQELFPVVWERLDQLAGTLSGGERRMLSIVMSMMWAPDLLLLDEPTVGLAPALAERMFDALKDISVAQGMSILCVEQSLHHLIRLVDRIYIIRNGRVVGEETTAQLAQRTDYWDLF